MVDTYGKWLESNLKLQFSSKKIKVKDMLVKATHYYTPKRDFLVKALENQQFWSLYIIAINLF